MSGEESDDPQALPEEPEVISSPEPEVLSSPEFWTEGLDGPVSAPPPPIPVPGDLTATPAVKASKAEQRREAEELARADEPVEGSSYFWRGKVAPLTPRQASVRHRGFSVGPLSAYYPSGSNQQPVTPPNRRPEQ